MSPSRSIPLPPSGDGPGFSAWRSPSLEWEATWLSRCAILELYRTSGNVRWLSSRCCRCIAASVLGGPAARRALEKRYPGFPAQYLCIGVLISLYRALSRPCALLGFLEFRCCLCRLPQCIGRHRCTIKIEDFARLGVTEDPDRPPAPVGSPTPRRAAGVHRRLAVAEFRPIYYR